MHQTARNSGSKITDLQEIRVTLAQHANEMPWDKTSVSHFSSPRWRAQAETKLEEATSGFAPNTAIPATGPA